MNLDSHNLAWAAGFFDGEGHTSFSCQKIRETETRKRQVKVALVQVDPDVLYRFREAVGNIGKIYGPYKKKQPGRSPIFQYNTTTFETTQAVIAMLWPYLGHVKRKQAKAALFNYVNFKGKHNA